MSIRFEPVTPIAVGEGCTLSIFTPGRCGNQVDFLMMWEGLQVLPHFRPVCCHCKEKIEELCQA